MYNVCLTSYPGAPECCRFDDFDSRQPLEVKQSVDIWSLGCVLSEVSVWLVLGKEALEGFRKHRAEETSDLCGFEDQGCFHNGETVLESVISVHEKVCRSIRNSDHITRAVIENMLSEMLDQADGRPHARQLRRRSRRILEKAATAGKESKAQQDSQTGETSPMNERYPSELSSPRPWPPVVPPEFESSSSRQTSLRGSQGSTPDRLQTPHNSNTSRTGGKRKASSSPTGNQPRMPKKRTHSSRSTPSRDSFASRDREGTQELLDGMTSGSSDATLEHRSQDSHARNSSRSTSDSVLGTQNAQETSPKAKTANRGPGANQATSPGSQAPPSIDFTKLYTAILEKEESGSPREWPEFPALKDMGHRDHVRYLKNLPERGAESPDRFSSSTMVKLCNHSGNPRAVSWT